MPEILTPHINDYPNKEDYQPRSKLEELLAYQAQLSRLQTAVIDAAKVYHDHRGYGPQERALMLAVGTLIEFGGSQHKS